MGYEKEFHFLKCSLIGLFNFCIVVNTMNIWIDIYGSPTFDPKIKKNFETHDTILILRVMLQPQTILQYFYKMLMWPTSYRFSSKSTINITFSFTNNHSPHQ